MELSELCYRFRSFQNVIYVSLLDTSKKTSHDLSEFGLVVSITFSSKIIEWDDYSDCEIDIFKREEIAADKVIK